MTGTWAADLVIVASHAAILAAIATVLRRRRDLSRRTRRLGVLMSLTLLLGMVVLLFGITGRVPLPVGWAAAAAWGALAVVLWPEIPRVLALPSPAELAAANARLARGNETLAAEVERQTHDIATVRQRFEQALAGSNITVYTQDRNLRFTWLHNPRAGLYDGDMIGRTGDGLLPPEEADAVRALKEQALRTRATGSLSLNVQTETEGMLHLDLTVSPTFDSTGAVDGVLCTLFDYTEQRLFERRLTAMAGELATSYRRFELALEGSPIGVFEQDRALRYTYVHNPPGNAMREDFIERTDREVFGPTEALTVAKQRVLETGQREQLETELTFDGRAFYYLVTVEPRFGRNGRIEGVIGTTSDLTERRQAERQMHLVMRELTHRSKNLLAVVQSMARKTAALSDNTDDFIEAFSSRLRAIASAHDLLVSKSWSGARLGDLVSTTLAQSIDPSGPQVAISGPDLMLTPDTAQNLALALHELTTNAMKYGALSVEGGRVAITWTREDGMVRLRWEEERGPEVLPPQRNGFGRLLLERLVGATLGGAVEMNFRPEGVICDVSFSMDRLVTDGAA